MAQDFANAAETVENVEQEENAETVEGIETVVPVDEEALVEPASDPAPPSDVDAVSAPLDEDAFLDNYQSAVPEEAPAPEPTVSWLQIRVHGGLAWSHHSATELGPDCSGFGGHTLCMRRVIISRRWL